MLTYISACRELYIFFLKRKSSKFFALQHKKLTVLYHRDHEKINNELGLPVVRNHGQLAVPRGTGL